MKASFLVVGSAHLDVLARASHRDDVVDRIGDVSIEVGGTACNIAINLVKAGAHVRFLSAMNNSVYSRLIVDYLTEMDVETIIATHPELPTGGFSAHIDTKGEMHSAISSMPVERVNFDDAQLGGAMDGVRAVVVDCNLATTAINRIVAFANDRNLPVYIAAVSEEKSLRIGGVTGRVAAVFMNRAEFQFFCRTLLDGRMSPSDAAQAIGATVVMTDGPAGAVLARPGVAPVHLPAPDLAGEGSRLGMGDALMAGVVYFRDAQGFPLEEAARRALSIVQWVGDSRHCHAGALGAIEGAIERYRYQAGHDPMTGVLNRHSLERELAKVLDRRHGEGETIGILMLDIDHFKGINDTFGHNAGDDVIIGVSKIVREIVREFLRDGDFVGRWGGEEFVVILPGAGWADVKMVGERVRAGIEARLTQPRPVTVSVGCSVARRDAESDIRALVGAADAAMYQAKQEGRNRVVVAREAVSAAVVH